MSVDPSVLRGESLVVDCVGALEGLLEIVDSADTSPDTALDSDVEESTWSSNFTPVQHRRRIYLDTRQQLDTEQIMHLQGFYRQECEVKNNLQDAVISSLFDKDIPQPKRKLEGGAWAQQVQQGPSLNTADFGLIGQGQLQRITCEADRIARAQGWIETARNLPGFGLPVYKEHVLEMFFLIKPEANGAEIFSLTFGLQLPRQAVEQFFERKLELTKEWRQMIKRLGMKRFLRRVERKGLLEEMQQVELARARSIQDMKRDEAGRELPQQ
ncbi:hypothetical protein DOTSEDRAFT_29108 [Dothistroma septosporum NZE10]|uniref:Uncharacterized protein n=1 Tax=Dothistroma septosporum (strain NZE10 / CBS 128990) TaxID=675120 RepID=M2YJ03_DOTSN|nr:hypothetical protein DOTSEDRAFT_29108 [Dothistroma septosporum NZE10]